MVLDNLLRKCSNMLLVGSCITGTSRHGRHWADGSVEERRKLEKGAGASSIDVSHDGAMPARALPSVSIFDSVQCRFLSFIRR